VGLGGLALVVSGTLTAGVSGALAALVSGVLTGPPVVESCDARGVPGLSQAVKRKSVMKLTEGAIHLIIYTSNQQVQSGCSS
jgi:hypothetical protein